MKKHWLLATALFLFAFVALHLVNSAFAASPVPLPSSVAAVGSAGGAQAVSNADLIQAVGDTIHAWGGLVWQLKIAALVMLLIASMKVTVMDKYVWDKLGAVQPFAAPILGLIVGFLSLAASHALSLVGLLAYLSAGAGAILLHELLDGVKAWPGIGPAYVAAISAIEGALGGNPVGAQDAAQGPASAS